MKSKRIKWLDFAKGFAIFFVVLAHWGSAFLRKDTGIFNDTIEIILYLSFTFVMPLFFSISGYLYKHISSLHDYLLLIYKKVVSLLIPYLFFSILLTLNAFSHHQVHSVFDFFLGYKYSSYLWFLVALFFIFIIVGLFDLMHLNAYIQILIFLILTVIQPDFWLLTNNINIHLNLIYCTVGYALFFYLGLILKKLLTNKDIVTKIKALNFKSLVMLILVWFIILIIQSRFTVPTYQVDFLTLSDAFTKFSIVVLSFLIFVNLKNDKLFNYFTYYGKYTLIIYLSHMLFIMILEHFMPTNITLITILFVIGIFIIWELTIFTCYLSNKVRLINFIFYPRKYINKWIVKTQFGKYLLEK